MSQRERPAPRGSPATGRPASGYPAVPSAESLPRLLDRLLAGDGLDDLPALGTHTFIDNPPHDSDPRELAAVSLAMRTPDVLLVRVSSSALGTRIADTIVAAAGRSGERVHVIGPQPGACRCRESVSALYDQLCELAWQHDELNTQQHLPRPRGLVSRLVRRIFGGSAGDTEVATRTAVIDREADVIADKWRQAVGRLPAECPPPDAMTVPASAAARDVWRRHRNGDCCEAGGLLVLTDAQSLADLPAVVGRASRVALIGESGIGPFDHLWTLLHSDPWRREGKRLVCRLRPVQGRLDAEPVADRPDVELRIHTPPYGETEVAEVAFPAETPIAAAVEWVFRELGELPSSPVLGTRHSALATQVAELGDGVRAVIAPTAGGWSVPLVEFPGWDRERANAWARRHVVQAGSGRTIDLTD